MLCSIFTQKSEFPTQKFQLEWPTEFGFTTPKVREPALPPSWLAKMTAVSVISEKTALALPFFV